MSKDIAKCVRLPQELARRAENEAFRLGLSFSDYVLNALRQALGDGGDPAIDFLRRLAIWLEGEFDPHNFPPDVTLRVFHHIRDSAALRREYEALITRADGRRDWEAVAGLHRRIGLLVKVVLGAEVIGRSLPLDPGEHLVRTHSLLRPGNAPPAAAGAPTQAA